MSSVLSASAEVAELKVKLDSLDQMAASDLAQLAASKETADLSRMSSSERKAMAAKKLKLNLQDREHDEVLAGGAVEAATLVCLKHLDYFLLHASASAPLTPYQRAHRRYAGKLMTKKLFF